MTQQFDAIVFDFDGVLVESADVKTRAFAALYAEYGPAIEQQVVAHHLDHAGISRYVKFQHYHEKLLGRPYSDAIGEELSTRFSRLVVDAIVAAPCVAGALDFLENFHDRMPLFVASGTPDEELKEIVQRRGMQGYFKSVHGTPATKGKIIAGIVQRHRFAATRVVMIGDAMADHDGAREAGVAFVGRVGEDSGVFPAGTNTIADLRELPQLL